MTPEQIIKQIFAGTPFLIEGKAYHSPLPTELRPWYCYTSDGGHSILCLLENHITAGELWKQLCPVPVKTVLRGYQVLKGGWIVVRAPHFKYDDQLGLQTNPADDEY